MAHDACTNVERQCASFELLGVEIGALLCINLHEYLENDDPGGTLGRRSTIRRAHTGRVARVGGQGAGSSRSRGPVRCRVWSISGPFRTNEEYFQS